MKYILKINCPDQKGLMYKISKIIYECDLNIDKNDEFVDEEFGRFFFRAQIQGKIDVLKLKNLLSSVLPEESNLYLSEKKPKNIIIMATKENHALGDILLRNESGELNANILAVISNYDSLRNLVEKFNIKYHFVSHEGSSRDEHERAVLDVLSQYELDFIVLAKYMRILSSNFVASYGQKIINIHHSFLPAFIGANPYKQAYDRGVKIIGATAHFVTNDLDEGPIIVQDVTAVSHTYGWKDMQRAGRNIEKSVLDRALEIVFDDRIFVNGNKTVIF